MKALRPILLLVSAISFGLGISLPLVRFEKFWIFAETPSLIEVITDLYNNSELLLAIAVCAFSILFPIIKMAATFQSAFNGKKPRGWTAALSKWSMMDVLLVAILILAAKTTGLAQAFSQPGLWFYGLSSITIAIASLGLSTQRK